MARALMAAAMLLFVLAGVMVAVAVLLCIRFRSWEAAAFLWRRRRRRGRKGMKWERGVRNDAKRA